MDERWQPQRFALLTTIVRNDPFVLAGPCDVRTAQVFESAGFPALAIADAAISAAFGYQDNAMPRDEMFAAITRIARSVQAPVSAGAPFINARIGAFILGASDAQPAIDRARLYLAAGPEAEIADERADSGLGGRPAGHLGEGPGSIARVCRSLEPEPRFGLAPVRWFPPSGQG
jgi:2-methylisocitrate lyase-like PEP mutase family enzyme